MREILFRGKVLWNGQHYFSCDWVEGFYAYKSLEDKHVIMVERAETQRYASYFVEIQVDPNTVGQYTGLKDKNGVMIYEGDVVETRTNTVYNWEGLKKEVKDEIVTTHEIVWNEDGWAKKELTDTRWTSNWSNKGNIRNRIFGLTEKFYTVIGNIHDKED